MHLVLRDVPTTAQIPSQPTPTTAPMSSAARDTSPAPANGPQPQRPYAPSPQQQFLNTMQRRMLQASRESMAQAVVNQNQRGRAQMGMRGIGDNSTQQVWNEARDPRVNPALTGPNSLSLHELQQIMQQADASTATATMTNARNNAMQRSASSASMHSRPLNQPGVTMPIFPGSASRAGSGRSTPFGGVGGPGGPQRPGQEVYILTSPEGPRALLVNNTTAETYYTPAVAANAVASRQGDEARHVDSSS